MIAATRRRLARLRALTVLCVLLALCACGDDPALEVLDDTPAPPSVAPPDAPELLVVTIDTWRFDHADWSGLHPAELTPHMAALAERGVIFERAYSPMNQTLPAHATLFTGLSPREHGALENQYQLHERFETLAESLTQAGWITGAFIGAGVLHESTGIAQGFTRWDLPPTSELEQLGVPERPASAVSAAARKWWQAQSGGRPRFAWAHFYDPHAYYRPPDEALAQVPRAATDALIAERAPRLQVSVSDLVLANAWHDYAGEVRATDAEVGALIDTVLSGERGANTFVVVVSDHGEGLYEHGEASHELTLYENQMRVPLFVFGPGVRAGERVSTPVELADLRPTLERLVLRREPSRSAGRDLSAALTEGTELGLRPIFLERPHLTPERVRSRSRGFLHGSIEGGVLAGVVHGTDKLLRQPTGELLLFDLLADPGELNDLSSQQPERRRELERLLDAWIARRPTPALGSGASADEQQLARLRALGYIK